MQITERNLKRIMEIEDLSRRKDKLQDFCLSIGWHGGPWARAMEELDRLNKIGVKTELEKFLNQKGYS